MHDLNGNWVGTISGTNNGDVFAEMRQTGDTVAGNARIQDRLLGVTVYSLTGRIEGDQVFLSLTPESRHQDTAATFLVGGRPVKVQIPAIVSGNVSVQALIGKAGLSGKWESSVGTGGVFSASKVKPEAEASIEISPEKDQVFVMMPIATDKPELEDILAAIKRSARRYEIECLRVDEIEHTGKITDMILNQINCSRYLVCDISVERPNVYYELGYAHGRRKEVIVIAREGSTIHFDIKDYNIIFYKNITELEERLSKRIEGMRAKQGRRGTGP